MTEEGAERFVPYELRPGWTDLEPIPQNDGENPMVPILYTEKYRSGMSMFRALVKKGEHSERVIQLTYDLVQQNPGHYSVWAYRAETLLARANKEELLKELDLLDHLVKATLKSYQIWQHRRRIVLCLEPEISAIREIEFSTKALKIDAKNYHTWAYRQWALCHFWGKDAPEKYGNVTKTKQDIWDDELGYCEELLEDDVRNNSAWNHRFFVVFNSGINGNDGQAFKERELEFAKQKILLTRHNASAWNYLRGVLGRTHSPLSELDDFVRLLIKESEAEAKTETSQETTNVNVPYLALEYLADSAAESGKSSQANELYDDLASRYDPIRKPYWNLRKDLLRV